MVSLEQVRLLESKVTKTINYVKTVTEENTALRKKLDSCQKRIDELEILIQHFKEEQSKIEDGILAALDRLNQFEDALESKLSEEEPIEPSARRTTAADSGETKLSAESKLPQKPAAKQTAVEEDEAASVEVNEATSVESTIRGSPEEEIEPELTSGELDIF